MNSKSPKDIENRIVRLLTSWENLAPTKSFAGITLEQCRTAVAASLTSRQQIGSLEDQLERAIDVRDSADVVSLAKLQQVVNGILADGTEGPDSSLYAALGYIRKSERKSGLTRKSHRAPAPTA
jgi:hypothetical protein